MNYPFLIRSLQEEVTFQADRFGRRILADELNDAAKAIEELTRRSVPENKPLTLEQLRRMDGEPVWNEKTGYRLVGNFYEHVNLYALREQSVDAEGLMNLGEKIYARRPESTQ